MKTVDGCIVDDRTGAMIQEVKSRLANVAPVRVTQGSYSTGVGASAGTHSGGGAVDIALSGLTDDDARTIETTMREVGFAAWYRPAIPGVWPRHVHGIAIGCGDLAPQAAAQVTDYRNGRDGLANHGPDTGSRAHVGETWDTYTPPAADVARAVWEHLIGGPAS